MRLLPTHQKLSAGSLCHQLPFQSELLLKKGVQNNPILKLNTNVRLKESLRLLSIQKTRVLLQQCS